MPDKPQSSFAPLRQPVFRRIWLASLMSNLGLLIQGVGAAWAMTMLTDRADMIALVQSAFLIPIMLFAIPAGALADMFDRRVIGLCATALSLSAAITLTTISYLGLLTPAIILTMTFLLGTGMALFGPSWQASAGEQVPPPMLPAAIALNSISYNVGRSFGPAIGGIIVAALGATATFLINALFYLPLMIVLYVWRRPSVEPRLPPERIGRAMISGVRYAMNAPSIRTIVIRTALSGLAGGAAPALMPLIARDILSGGASSFGFLLGAYGLGAVAGAAQVGRLRRRFSAELLIKSCSAIAGAAMVGLAMSQTMALSLLLLVIIGAAWMVVQTSFNVAIQLAAPRWVTGRSLAAFQSAAAGGMGIGSWIWGHVAADQSTAIALMAAGVLLLLAPALGFWLRAEELNMDQEAITGSTELDVVLSLTGRSGPIVVEVDYIVPARDARHFYLGMQQVQSVRQRNGGYGWSLSRALGDEDQWTERFHCPTWHDYLRMRDRNTAHDQAIVAQALLFAIGHEPSGVRRYLERPFGSVRWRDDTPDPGISYPAT
jgi:MFS family permease